jgi:hypothetical protein
VNAQQWKREKRRITLREPCPAKSCEAAKGQPCRNRAGHPVPYFHTGRVDKAMRKHGHLILA